MNGSRVVGFDGPSRDRLVYSTMFLRGHRVEVQVKDGSMYSGIFHAASIGKDMGNVLYTFGAWFAYHEANTGKEIVVLFKMNYRLIYIPSHTQIFRNSRNCGA